LIYSFNGSILLKPHQSMFNKTIYLSNGDKVILRTYHKGAYGDDKSRKG